MAIAPAVQRPDRRRTTWVELRQQRRQPLPSALRRCLGTTNLLDAAHSGTRGKLRRVTTWRDGAMAARWVAAAMVETEKCFRKIQGHHQLWMLEANLKERCERRKAHATGNATAPAVARAGAAA